MKFMQQNNYYNYRLVRFMFEKFQLVDKRVSIPFLFAAILSLFVQEQLILAIPAIAMCLQIYREKNPTKGGIKPLNITGRVKRIFGVAFALWLGATTLSLFIPATLFYMTAIVVIAPLFLIAANTILVPYEWLDRKKYLDEAKAKLKKFNPIVIGVTGSFGKTSVKNILHHILGSFSSSFATKRSINTIMGIVRVIREEMNSQTKYFVAEMGTGQPGQIAQLARFLRPTHGIITAVGSAHLENFKTVDAIAREKFALSRYVGKNGGQTILAAANIDPEFIKKYAAQDDIVFSGKEVSNIKQTIDGLSFTLTFDGKKHEVFAPIYGMHQAQNIAISFMMAARVGANPESIISALKTLKQTEHRLEVKREGELIVIDDAFNSNMSGFISALETGDAIKGKGRFILITPGMVGLDAAHAEQHMAVGKVANKLCDVVIAVNPDRIKDFTKEISAKKLVLAPTLTEARTWLASNAQPGDVVLYENDLPDLYIEKIRI